MNPKYQIVAEALRDGILDGTYQKTLPTEQALCAQFQVSRQTVRQALSLLETERLIDRRQGSGSHIRERKASVPRGRLCIAVVTTYISDYIFPQHPARDRSGVLGEQQRSSTFRHAEPV